MILGQSIGAAASIAIEMKVAVQDVPYDQSQKILIANNQILEKPEGWMQIITDNN